MIGRLARELAFARAVPPRQIAARIARVARTRVEGVLQPPLGRFAAPPSATPPEPLFPPRSASLSRTGDGWTFDALGCRTDFTAAIDWQRPGPPGRDQLWRMTLHYMEYLEALGDADFEDVVGQWIAGNPPYSHGAPHHSWNPYALSLRSVVWMQQLAARAASLPADFASRARHALVQQIDYLSRHLETDIGGNHLIKNIKALLWAGAFFDGPRAATWRETGTRLLTHELDRQLLPDGMHYERSPSYHCQVFADLSEIRLTLRAGSLRDRLTAALARAAAVIAQLVHPDGLIAHFSDAGLQMAYSPQECLAAHERSGASAPAALPVFSLVDAGYFGFRSERSYLVIDAGPIAPASLPAHGHGDIGSFEWSVGGERMVVDQGVFEYLAGPRRAWSRSAVNHNTLCPEGMDQATFFGAFRAAHLARVSERSFTADDGSGKGELVVAHDGFTRYGGPVHRRTFTVHPLGFRIDDQLDRPVSVPASVTILLHPSVAIRSEPAQGQPAGCITLSLAGGRATVQASHPLTVEDWVWWPDIGHEQPTRRLRLQLPPATTSCWTEFTIVD